MYYGPNYDATNAGVSPPVSTSPDPPTDKELHESEELHDHDHVEDDDHSNDDNHVEHHDLDPHHHVDDLDCGDDLDHRDDDDDDDDNDWITPDNLHRAREQMGGATTVSAKGVAVGCLTTDFSMQVYSLSVCLYVHVQNGPTFSWEKNYHKIYRSHDGLFSNNFIKIQLYHVPTINSHSSLD